MRMFVKSALLILTLLLCAGQMLRGARLQAWTVEEESESATQGQSVQAAKLFNEKCARCHGADGRGHTIIGGILGVPDFTNDEWWNDEKSESRLVHSITEGKGEMPAFGKKLSRREISTLAAHVRGFRRKTER